MVVSNVVRVQVARNPSYKPSGLKSYVHALNKFNIHPNKPGPYHREAKDQPLMVKLADGTSGAVSAHDQQNDSFYTCAVQIGTPPQTVNLDFDSGSSDLWVKSTELKRSSVEHERAAGIALFDPTKSSTFQKLDKASWKIQYGDGSGASGDVGTDVLHIGSITVEHQAIQCATRMSTAFAGEQSSGLLGLAWGSINTVKPTPVKTPVENMIAQQDIPKDQELFTVCLGSVKDKSESFYTFGAIDQELVQRSGQAIHWAPVDNSQGFWMYDSPSMTVKSNKIDTSGNKAILDTGTTLCLVDNSVLDQIYGQVPGAYYDDTQQAWLIPTANVDARPVVSFAIGDTQFLVPKQHLAFAPVTDNMSYGAIQSRGDLPFDIMGDAMLMGIYAVFDVGNKRIGCVQRPDLSPSPHSQA